MEIELQNINYEYKKINYLKKEIFNNLNIKLDSNIDCIVGNNGSGKTTLLDIITNNIKSEGVIKFSKKPKIGYVKETIEFLSDTIRQELIYSLMEHEYKISEKRMLDVLVMVGINPNLIDNKINTLSYSQKKLLSLACSLIYNPNILILDNFTDNLDDTNKKNILKLIQ